MIKWNVVSNSYLCNGQSYILGCGEYKTTGDDKYIKCVSEADLLHKFIDLWKELDPDIITGWNVEMFDIPYTVNRIQRRLSIEAVNQLSPWGIVKDRLIEISRVERLILSLKPELILVDNLSYFSKFKDDKQQTAVLSLPSLSIPVGKVISLHRLEVLTVRLASL